MRTIVPSSTQSNRLARNASHPDLTFLHNLFAICSLLAHIAQFSKWGPQEYSRPIFIVSLALEKEGNSTIQTLLAEALRFDRDGRGSKQGISPKSSCCWSEIPALGCSEQGIESNLKSSQVLSLPQERDTIKGLEWRQVSSGALVTRSCEKGSWCARDG